MATETTDLTLEILKRIQADHQQMRRDVVQIQQSQVDLMRIVSRLDTKVSDAKSDLERRLSEVKSDLESMLRMEIIGALTHHTTRMEQMLQDGLIGIIERLDRAEPKKG